MGIKERCPGITEIGAPFTPGHVDEWRAWGILTAEAVQCWNSNLTSAVYNAIGYADTWLVNHYITIWQEADSQFQILSSWYATAIALEDAGLAQDGATRQIIAAIAAISGAIATSAGTTNTVIRNMEALILGAIEASITASASTQASIETLLINQSDILTALADTSADQASALIMQDIADSQFNAAAALEDIAIYIQADHANNIEVVNGLLAGIEAQISSVAFASLSGATAVASEINALTSGLPAGFEDMLRRLGTDALANAAPVGAELLSGLATAISDKFSEFNLGSLGELDTISKKLQETIATSVGLPQIISLLFNDVLHEANPARTFILYSAIPFILGLLFTQLTQPEQAILLHAHSRLVPWQLLTLDELVKARRRNIIDEDKFINDATGLGFDTSDIQAAQGLDQLQIPANDLITWWLRGFIDEETFDAKILLLGIRDEDRDNIKKAAILLPGPSDLVTMAVREVFSPEVAEKFGQFDDFPEPFKEWAAKQGLSEFWAKNIWAAHWGLPSVQMGYEMLHRGIITVDELKMLLRAQDVMPFWRDKLIAMSYANYTRVDIRRMHAMEILTNEEVLAAHLAIGYSKERAQNLTKFVISLNTPDAILPYYEAVHPTRAQIIEYYRRGTIQDIDAQRALEALGYNVTDAIFIINEVNIQIDLQARKDEIDTLVSEARFGILSFEALQDQLAQQGMEGREIAIIIARYQKEERQKITVPSRENLGQFYNAQLIDRDLYFSSMRVLGYSDAWIERYLLLLGK